MRNKHEFLDRWESMLTGVIEATFEIARQEIDSPEDGEITALVLRPVRANASIGELKGETSNSGSN